jgi:hypothetical protein
MDRGQSQRDGVNSNSSRAPLLLKIDKARAFEAQTTKVEKLDPERSKFEA